MIIHLNKSKLFTVHPCVRLAAEYNVPKEIWAEIWKRYILMAYDVSELCEYFLIKTKQEITEKSMRRWILRTHVYTKAQDAIKRGAEVVKSDFFDGLEEDVIAELTKSMRFSGSRKAKNIL